MSYEDFVKLWHVVEQTKLSGKHEYKDHYKLECTRCAVLYQFCLRGWKFVVPRLIKYSKYDSFEFLCEFLPKINAAYKHEFYWVFKCYLQATGYPFISEYLPFITRKHMRNIGRELTAIFECRHEFLRFIYIKSDGEKYRKYYISEGKLSAFYELCCSKIWIRDHDWEPEMWGILNNDRYRTLRKTLTILYLCIREKKYGNVTICKNMREYIGRWVVKISI
jgi:hypothetical protein